MPGTDPTRTATGSELLELGPPSPGLLLARAPAGASTTDRARIARELRVGRGTSCDWVIEDDRVSGVHLRVRPFGEALIVSDEGSRNGTFVDGEALDAPRTVGWGAVIRAGRCLFVPHPDLRSLEVPTAAAPWLVGPFFAAPLLRRLDVAVRTGRHVLLFGDSGTGKELCARWLAERTAPGRPFVTHNCARSSSAEEAESTIFGVSKGVFSGVDARAGLLEEADGGVLLLDEIHTLPIRVQRSLLRFAEDGQHARIGSTAQRGLLVRLLLATNVPLPAPTAPGAAEAVGLAADLVARLHVVAVPDLAERRADVPAIFVHALRKAAAHAGLDPAPLEAALTVEAFEALCLEDWTGRNVRGLEHLAAEAVAWAMESAGEPEAVWRRVLGDHLKRRPPARESDDASGSLYERHRARIVEVFQSCGGNLTRTERTLRDEGIAVNRRWLADFLRRWGIRP